VKKVLSLVILVVNVIWKLVGIVDIQNNSLTELSCEKRRGKCYTLLFLTDDIFASTSSSNYEEGNYNANYATNTIKIKILGGTKVGETADGMEWSNILRGHSATIDKFELKKRELKLYYNNGKNYLLFKSM